jgi:3-mercaptopyruvate sulfurtransferase SseA
LLVLTEAGYTNVQVYDGAWVEWSANEAPAEKPAQTVPSIPSAT